MVTNALRGDSSAQAELARRLTCVPRILAAMNMRVGRPLQDHELADAGQEVAIVVWQKAAEYQGRASLETWVYPFCQFEFLRCLRRRRRSSRVEPCAAEAIVDPGDLTTPAEMKDQLTAMTRHLSRREADVVCLRHAARCSFPEIAGALGITSSSAKTHYRRAIEKLRTVLGASRGGAA